MRWFHGGHTNAVFNEVDRHVLQMHGGATAFLSDPGDGACERTGLDQLALESVLVACSLTKDYDLASGQRIAFYLPNDYHAAVWIEAAKRVGLCACTTSMFLELWESSAWIASSIIVGACGKSSIAPFLQRQSHERAVQWRIFLVAVSYGAVCTFSSPVFIIDSPNCPSKVRQCFKSFPLFCMFLKFLAA